MAAAARWHGRTADVAAHRRAGETLIFDLFLRVFPCVFCWSFPLIFRFRRLLASARALGARGGGALARHAAAERQQKLLGLIPIDNEFVSNFALRMSSSSGHFLHHVFTKTQALLRRFWPTRAAVCCENGRHVRAVGRLEALGATLPGAAVGGNSAIMLRFSVENADKKRAPLFLLENSATAFAGSTQELLVEAPDMLSV